MAEGFDGTFNAGDDQDDELTNLYLESAAKAKLCHTLRGKIRNTDRKISQYDQKIKETLRVTQTDTLGVTGNQFTSSTPMKDRLNVPPPPLNITRSASPRSNLANSQSPGSQLNSNLSEPSTSRRSMGRYGSGQSMETSDSGRLTRSTSIQSSRRSTPERSALQSPRRGETSPRRATIVTTYDIGTVVDMTTTCRGAVPEGLKIISNLDSSAPAQLKNRIADATFTLHQTARFPSQEEESELDEDGVEAGIEFGVDRYSTDEASAREQQSASPLGRAFKRTPSPRTLFTSSPPRQSPVQRSPPPVDRRTPIPSIQSPPRQSPVQRSPPPVEKRTPIPTARQSPGFARQSPGFARLSPGLGGPQELPDDFRRGRKSSLIPQQIPQFQFSTERKKRSKGGGRIPFFVQQQRDVMPPIGPGEEQFAAQQRGARSAGRGFQRGGAVGRGKSAGRGGILGRGVFGRGGVVGRGGPAGRGGIAGIGGMAGLEGIAGRGGTARRGGIVGRGGTARGGRGRNAGKDVIKEQLPRWRY